MTPPTDPEGLRTEQYHNAQKLSARIQLRSPAIRVEIERHIAVSGGFIITKDTGLFIASGTV